MSGIADLMCMHGRYGPCPHCAGLTGGRREAEPTELRTEISSLRSDLTASRLRIEELEKALVGERVLCAGLVLEIAEREKQAVYSANTATDGWNVCAKYIALEFLNRHRALSSQPKKDP